MTAPARSHHPTAEAGARPGPIGRHLRWLPLVGTLVFLAEFVFIIGFYVEAPAADTPAADVVAFYGENAPGAVAALLGIGAAFVGRILFFAAVREALRPYVRVRVLADTALALAVVAVTVETVQMMLQAAAANMAASGSEAAAAAAQALQHAVVGASFFAVAHGLSVVLAGVALLGSRLLPAWIGWLGVAGGLGYALSVGAAVSDGGFFAVAQSAGWLLILVWLLAVSVSFVRRAGRGAAGQTVPDDDRTAGRRG